MPAAVTAVHTMIYDLISNVSCTGVKSSGNTVTVVMTTDNNASHPLAHSYRLSYLLPQEIFPDRIIDPIVQKQIYRIQNRPICG